MIKYFLIIITSFVLLLFCVKVNDRNMRSENFDKMIDSLIKKSEDSIPIINKSSVNYLFLYHEDFESFVNQTCWDNRELSGKCETLDSKNSDEYYKCLRESYVLCSNKVSNGYEYLKDRTSGQPFWQIITEAKITQPYIKSFNASNVEYEAFFDHDGNLLANKKGLFLPIPYMRYYFNHR